MIPQKPWGEFFSRFSFPKPNWASYERRLAANVLYYRANYVFLALALCTWTLLRNFKATAVLALLALLWSYVTVLHRGGRLIIGRKPIAVNSSQRLAALLAASAVLIFGSGTFLTLLYCASISAAAILLHATLRTATLKSTVHKFGVDMKARGIGGMKFGGGLDSDADGSSPGSPTAAAERPVKARNYSYKKGGTGSDPEDGVPRGGLQTSGIPADQWKQTTTTRNRHAGWVNSNDACSSSSGGGGGQTGAYRRGGGYDAPTMMMSTSPMAPQAAVQSAPEVMMQSQWAPVPQAAGAADGGYTYFQPQQQQHA